MVKAFLTAICAAALCLSVAAGELIKLPPPQKEGGMGVFSALSKRRSQRNFSDKPISLQELSTLLWAGFGISSDDGKRTAPSAINRQEYTLYAILGDGAYKYLPVSNSLEKISSQDLREYTAGNVKAPAYILLVADMKRAANPTCAAIDAGFISQNIYLAATARNIGTCVMAGFSRNRQNMKILARALQLTEECKPMLSQALGTVK